MKINKPKQKAPSVSCAECFINIMPSEKAVVSHFMQTHDRVPADKEFRLVLSNSYSKKFQKPNSKAKGAPT